MCTNEFVHAKICKAEANKAPFRGADFSYPLFLGAHNYFHSSSPVCSFENEPNVLGVSIQTLRSLEKNSERKQFSFPEF